jgi:hypothetical protein
MFPDRFVVLRVFFTTEMLSADTNGAAIYTYNTRRSSPLYATQLPLDLHTLAIQTVGIIFMTGC